MSRRWKFLDAPLILEHELTAVAVESVTDLLHRREEPVRLWINYQGGDIHLTNTLLDFIDRRKAPTATVITGAAASGASVLAMYGTRGFRWVSPTAMVSTHYGNVSLRASDRRELMNLYEDYMTLDLRNDRRMAKRLGITVMEYRRDFRTPGTRPFTPRQWVLAGGADHIGVPR